MRLGSMRGGRKRGDEVTTRPGPALRWALQPGTRTTPPVPGMRQPGGLPPRGEGAGGWDSGGCIFSPEPKERPQVSTSGSLGAGLGPQR